MRPTRYNEPAMRVTYTLSWEEFAEVYTDSWPKPNLVAFIATIGFAITFGVFGILLARALGPGEWRVAWLFCALSLFMLGGAIWELRFRTAQLKKQMMKEVRSLYERFYSKEQTFTLDQDRWGYETENSKKEVTWAGLINAVEWQNVIALFAKDQLAVVPKRTLTQNTLESLREAALRIRGTKYGFRSSFVDRALTEFTLPWKDHTFAMLLGHALGVGALVMLVRRLGRPAEPGDFFWGELLCAWILFIIVTAQFWYLVLKYLLSYEEMRLPFEAEFSERGMWVRKPTVEFFRSWPAFRKFRENRRCFLLYTDAYRYFILAKRSIPPEQLQAVRVLLQAKVPTE